MAAKEPKKPPRKPAKRYSSDPKIRAAELVAEGKLGGKREGAGRPRKVSAEAQQQKLAMTTVTERLRENAVLLASVIPDVLNDPNATKREKMSAARLAIRIEGVDEDRRREEQSQGRRSDPPDLDGDRDDLISGLVAKLAGNPILRSRLSAALGAADAPAGDSSDSG